MDANQLVAILQKASSAYYETNKPILTDEEYDSFREQLESIQPNHPFLKSVGAPVSEGAVQLPHHMPSLKKVKPDTLSSVKMNGPFIVSEKLDGISALLVTGMSRKPRLLLRGNGSVGQDVSHIMKHIQGLRPCGMVNSVAVRGELIAPKETITAARNWVNGLIHQSQPNPDELKKIHFVAYSVYEPKGLTRQQQMTWLQNQGFEVAWNCRIESLHGDSLKTHFMNRRKDSIYDCDGIVVGTDTIPLVTTDATPKDAFAYKEAVEDQMATTVVVDVEYASSRKDQWIPRIRIKPVKIGNATIEYCTGHNAQYIKENSIGPGASVIIRRSGDVIPKLDKVLQPAPAWAEPPSGRWKWDETNTHAIDTSETQDANKYAVDMVHSLSVFGVERISESTALKLIEGGVKTIHDISKTSLTKLQELIGPTNGKNLKESLARLLSEANSVQWINAYPSWPKGFGEKKILSALEAQSDIMKWPSMTSAPKGQTMKTFQDVQKAVPEYLKWRAAFGAVSLNQKPVVASSIAPVKAKGNYVMTGFRDADLQSKLGAAGWNLQDKVNKQTNVLLVADDAKETVKVKTAREAGIRILPRAQALELL